MEIGQEAHEYYRSASNGDTSSGYRRKRALRRTLPVLSDLVDQSSIVSTVELGIREIKLDRVLGTFYSGRSNMFAGDFIPIAKMNTEFAYKWISLCGSQIEEGIKEPILVYEYLNYYYVQEGNKRVSVLKYLEAPTIAARVIRLVPAFDENSFDISIYYAFLDFFDLTDYEDIWFRNPSCFESMIAFMDQTDDKESYKDYLKTYYVRFRRHLKKLALKLEECHALTTGDIFLGYCRMFGIEDLDEDLLRRRLPEVIHHINAETVIEVDADLPNSFNNHLLPTFRKIRVAFVFPYDKELNGWSRDHLRSMNKMSEEFGHQVIIESWDQVMSSDSPYETLKEVAENKYDFVFLIDEVMLAISEQMAVDYPKTIFLMCSGNQSSYLVPNYFGKTYQTNFLLGVYGAIACAQNRVGYVACDMNPQIYRAMRAFEAGYQSIRPKSVVIYASSEEALPDNITIAAYYRSVEKSHLTEGTVNTYLKKRKKKIFMAYTYWQWEKFYHQIFTHVTNGSLKKLRSSHKEARNLLFFHWGISTEVIGIRLNQALPSTASTMIFEHITSDISEGRMDIDIYSDTSGYEQWFEIYRNKAPGTSSS